MKIRHTHWATHTHTHTLFLKNFNLEHLSYGMDFFFFFAFSEHFEFLCCLHCRQESINYMYLHHFTLKSPKAVDDKCPMTNKHWPHVGTGRWRWCLRCLNGRLWLIHDWAVAQYRVYGANAEPLKGWPWDRLSDISQTVTGSNIERWKPLMLVNSCHALSSVFL